MSDLFDDPPANSPDDLGFGKPERPPKPHDPRHPDHPAQRPHNQLQPGEEPPTSWNVANVEMGIAEMRTFLAWCTDHDIDIGDHTVGSLYVALNAHGKDSFRWLCTQLLRNKFERLPDVGLISRAIKKRQAGLLYPSTEPERRA